MLNILHTQPGLTLTNKCYIIGVTIINSSVTSVTIQKYKQYNNIKIRSNIWTLNH